MYRTAYTIILETSECFLILLVHDDFVSTSFGTQSLLYLAEALKQFGKSTVLPF